MRFGPQKLPKKFFDPEEIEKMQEMYSQNVSISKIASNMARDKRLVNIFFKNPEFYQQLMDWKEKEKLQGVTNKPIEKKKKKMVNKQFQLKQQLVQQPEEIHTIESDDEEGNDEEEIIVPVLISEAEGEVEAEAAASSSSSCASTSNSGITPDMVYRNYMPSSLFSDDEEAHILELRDKGFSLSQIGKIIRKDRRVISFFLNAPELYAINKRGEKHYKPLKTHVRPVRNPLKTIATTPEKMKWKPACTDYNKISMEYRAVIKFLTKKGLTPPDIWDDMMDIYGKLNFDIDCLTYWHEQYVMGRESLLNDPRVPEFYSPTSVPTKQPSKKKQPVEVAMEAAATSSDAGQQQDNLKFKIKFGFGTKKNKS